MVLCDVLGYDYIVKYYNDKYIYVCKIWICAPSSKRGYELPDEVDGGHLLINYFNILFFDILWERFEWMK
jgi:hypothetical protein